MKLFLSRGIFLAATTGEDMSLLSVNLVITGLVVVFVVLVIMVYLIKGYSAIIGWGNKKKSDTADNNHEAPTPPPIPVSPKKNIPIVTAQQNDGIPDEIVAVIAAAVATLTDGKGTVRSIRESRSSGNRPVWGFAGLLENTRPF